MKQKTPERLELVPELPRNANGKIAKRDLRSRFGP
jgi:acyl-coenzyme A synthetase/AMP-(fatty) acid ligase